MTAKMTSTQQGTLGYSTRQTYSQGFPGHLNSRGVVNTFHKMGRVHFLENLSLPKNEIGNYPLDEKFI